MSIDLKCPTSVCKQYCETWNLLLFWSTVCRTTTIQVFTISPNGRKLRVTDFTTYSFVRYLRLRRYLITILILWFVRRLRNLANRSTPLLLSTRTESHNRTVCPNAFVHLAARMTSSMMTVLWPSVSCGPPALSPHVLTNACSFWTIAVLPSNNTFGALLRLFVCVLLKV